MFQSLIALDANVITFMKHNSVDNNTFSQISQTKRSYQNAAIKKNYQMNQNDCWLCKNGKKKIPC